MKRIAALAAALVVAAAPTLPASARGAGDGEVRGVSVLPAAGKVSVVIDLRGAVQVQDFTLANPARLVLDLEGARLTSPAVLYDGQNRGGIKNIRYAQFRPDVVRVVIDLDAAKDYHIDKGDAQVTVSFGADRTAFDAWSSQYAATPTPPAQPPVAGGDAPAATVTTPMAGNPAAVDQFLAMHHAEAEQSQAPRITVQWDKADIADVAAGFSAFSGRTIVVGKGITGTVSAEIKNQPWDLAFQAILESQGLAWQPLPGGIINVVNKADLARADSTVPVETRLVRINYAKASALVPSLVSMVAKGRGSVVADTAHNALVITDVQSRIDQDVSFIQALDVRTPQVSIQAKIIFVDRTDAEDMGIKYDLGTGSGCLLTGAHPCQFFNQLVQRPDPSTLKPVDTNGDGVPDAVVATGTLPADQTVVDLGGNALSALGNASQEVINPALQLIFSTAVGNFNLTSFVEALQTVQLADLQAEPSVTTSDNHAAEVLVGAKVPFRTIDVSSTANGSGVPTATVTFEQTGIDMKVTPHVTANRQILMEVHAENSSVQTAPVDIGYTIQTQQADNQILVNDGETAVIGGLTVTSVTVSKSGIPFLVDLPILGKLFGFTTQSEERRDLLILITPHIIDDLTTSSTGN